MIDGQRITKGSVYLTRFYIWNSGNQQITVDDLGDPLQWADMPMWGGYVGYYRIFPDQLAGNIQTGLRLKLLNPNTGIVLAFFTNNKPDISLTGSVSGGTGGIIRLFKRNKATFVNVRPPALTAALWFLASFAAFAARKTLGLTSTRGNYIAAIFVSALLGFFLTMIALSLVLVLDNYGLPPF